MIKKGIHVNEANLLMLGITFKENCPDVRNTKIVAVVKALQEYGITVTIYDPWANPDEVMDEYGLLTTNQKPVVLYDAVVLGVAHKMFKEIDFTNFSNEATVIFDVKGVLETTDGKL